jgi:Zn-dependent protease with chaperone function
MPEISFDFKKYINERRGTEAALARSGAAYAYPGDQKVLRTLSSVRPVTLAVEATVRLWKNVAKSEILGTSVKVTDKQFPELYALAVDCAERLHIAVPTIYVYPDVGVLNAHTFGTNEDSYIVLNGVLVDHLTTEELRFVVGHECGHIQNNHVVYMTALYYLMYSANVFIRWIVTPAVMALQSWTRRAEITCDRAGLICSGSLEAGLAALTKLALGSSKLAERLNVDEYLKQLEESQEGAGRMLELFHSHPYLPKRVEALRLFAETHYYLKATGQEPAGAEGRSLAWCDTRVKRLVSVFNRGKDKADKTDGADPAPAPEQEPDAGAGEEEQR